MALRLSDTDRELLKLQSRADELEERLDALLLQKEAAADLGIPGPSPDTLDHARKLVLAARAAVDAARRHATGGRRRRRA